jgi:hypothetical protein
MRSFAAAVVGVWFGILSTSLFPHHDHHHLVVHGFQVPSSSSSSYLSKSPLTRQHDIFQNNNVVHINNNNNKKNPIQRFMADASAGRSNPTTQNKKGFLDKVRQKENTIDHLLHVSQYINIYVRIKLTNDDSSVQEFGTTS